MKLPLKVSDSHGLCIVDAERKMVAEGNIDEDMKHAAWSADAADLANIVRYMNAHDALVSALKDIEWADSDGYECPSCEARLEFGNAKFCNGNHSIDCKLACALKLAEGK